MYMVYLEVSGWISAWCPRVKLSDLSLLEILGDELFLIKKCLQRRQILCGKTIQRSWKDKVFRLDIKKTCCKSEVDFTKINLRRKPFSLLKLLCILELLIVRSFHVSLAA